MVKEFERTKSVEDRQLDFIQERQKAYKLSFGGKNTTTKIIMDDLREFCFAEKTCFVPDNGRVSEIFEGRRQVWLRIHEHLDKELTELVELYTQGVR